MFSFSFLLWNILLYIIVIWISSLLIENRLVAVWYLFIEGAAIAVRLQLYIKKK